MIIVPQGAINFLAQFIQIVFKILIPYLQVQIKPFLDDLRVKSPKTKCNNEELALEIRCYILEYIQNL